MTTTINGLPIGEREGTEQELAEHERAAPLRRVGFAASQVTCEYLAANERRLDRAILEALGAGFSAEEVAQAAGAPVDRVERVAEAGRPLGRGRLDDQAALLREAVEAAWSAQSSPQPRRRA